MNRTLLLPKETLLGNSLTSTTVIVNDFFKDSLPVPSSVDITVTVCRADVSKFRLAVVDVHTSLPFNTNSPPVLLMVYEWDCPKSGSLVSNSPTNASLLFSVT